MTVFAPTNDAFSGFSVDELCSDIPSLTDILLYHVVPAVIPSMLIEEGLTTGIPTLYGSELTVTNCPYYFLTVDESNVIGTDVLANNGVIHVIDTVLLPPPYADAYLPSYYYSYSKGKGKGKGKGM